MRIKWPVSEISGPAICIKTDLLSTCDQHRARYSEDGGEFPEREDSKCNRWLCESPKLICWGEELHVSF